MEKETFYKSLDKILTIRVTEQKIADDFEKNDIISFLHLIFIMLFLLSES